MWVSLVSIVRAMVMKSKDYFEWLHSQRMVATTYPTGLLPPGPVDMIGDTPISRYADEDDRNAAASLMMQSPKWRASGPLSFGDRAMTNLEMLATAAVMRRDGSLDLREFCVDLCDWIGVSYEFDRTAG